MLRQEREVLQAVVAKATGIPRGTLGAYECGARLPCVPNLIKLAWYHRRTVDFLLRGYHERR
jgi:transcriptional regulator with XRE-family HTH domain